MLISRILRKLLLFLIVFSLGSSLYAYDFSVDRLKLVNALQDHNIDHTRVRMAILFDQPNNKKLKLKTNLLKTKKDLAFEMLKSFQVTDPIVTNKILTQNNLTSQEVFAEKSLLDQFAKRSSASHVLMVRMNEKNAEMLFRYELVNAQAQVVTLFEHPQPIEGFSDKKAPVVVRTADVPPVYEKVEEPLFEDSGFFPEYSPPVFLDDQNHSWMHFTPTALLIPRTYSLELNLWMKDLANTELPVKNFRWDGRWNKVQFGWQSYGSTEGTHHSSYYSVKFNAVDETIMPANLSIGWRGRAYWNDNNTELEDDNESYDDQNDRQNRSTLFLAITSKLNQLRSLVNFYLDNQSSSISGKLLLTSNVNLMAEGIYYYYPGDHIQGDSMAGVELISLEGTSFALTYQFETEQVMLVSRFDW